MHGHQSTETGLEAREATSVFERVLVPVDFSIESQAGIETALELKRRFGSQVCLFNLTTLGTNDDFRRGPKVPSAHHDLEREGKERLRILVEALVPGASSEVSVQVYVGEDVARWVHDVAIAWSATLVVLSSHPSHTVFRSLTEKIMRALKIPLLILK
jgi:nucleotide-binding universal stress UspA family protein